MPPYHDLTPQSAAKRWLKSFGERVRVSLRRIPKEVFSGSVLVLLALAVVLAAGAFRFGVTFPKILACFVFFIMLPGFILQNRLTPCRDVAETAALSFALGVFYNVILFIILISLGLDFTRSVSKWIPVAFIAVLLMTCLPAFFSSRKELPVIASPRSGHWVLGVSLLFSFCLLFTESTLILGSDALTYIPLIESWSGTVHLGWFRETPLDIFLQTRMWRSAIQPYLLIWTGTRGVNAHLVMASLTVPFIICAFYAFSRSLIENRHFIVISMLIFILHFGGLISNFSHANYSWYVGWTLYFVSTSLLLQTVRSGSLAKGILGSVLGLSIIFIHFNYFLIFIVGTFAMACAYFFWKSTYNPKIKTALAVSFFTILIISLLVFILDLIRHIPWFDTLPFYSHGELNFRMTRILGRGIIVNYYQTFLRWSGPLGVLAFVLTPCIRARQRTGLDDFTRGYMVLSMVIPLLALFHPFFAATVYAMVGKAGLYLYRLVYLCPYISLVALILYNPEDTGALLHPKPWRRALAVLTALCIVPVFAYQLLHYVPVQTAYRLQPYFTYITPLHRVPYRYDHPALSEAVDFIRRTIGSDQMFVSDPLSSWLIKAAAGNPVLDTEKHPDKIRRTASMTILSPATDINTTMNLLRKNKIEYLLINTTFSRQILFHYFGFDKKRDADFFLRKFRDHPGLFERIYYRDGIYIFRIRG